MTEEERDEKLEVVYDAIIGKEANGQKMQKGLFERVSSLEKFRWFILSAAFAGTATGNYLGVKGWPF